MAPSKLSTKELAARSKSLAAQAATKTLKRSIDGALDIIAAHVGRLQSDLLAASRAVGGDLTRPGYTDDLRALNEQRRRLEALQDALAQAKG